MNEKEISEIRRRFRPDKSNISRIRGCYVNESREIISEFNESLGMMTPEESEEILTILKKALSGTIGKNLIDIEFSTGQVLEAPEHKLLTDLKKSAIMDNDAITSLYQKIVESVVIEGSYMILVAGDSYDVPMFSKDGEKDEESTTVFSYFLCAICPIKTTKAVLGYHAHENKFCNIRPDYVVSAPEIGFMFPAFEDRGSNIYKVLYYTRNTKESQTALVDALFANELPMPAAAQKETFEDILSETVAEDCSFTVVKAVHAELSDIIEEHKENKVKEPLVIDKNTVKDVLRSCAIPEERIRNFEERFDEAFGAETEVSPKNLINNKQFELAMPDVSIKVNPEHSDLIRTRVIDGVKYIMIRADETVEVNGVRINIEE